LEDDLVAASLQAEPQTWRVRFAARSGGGGSSA
jgi:hypothetical protein